MIGSIDPPVRAGVSLYYDRYRAGLVLYASV